MQSKYSIPIKEIQNNLNSKDQSQLDEVSQYYQSQILTKSRQLQYTLSSEEKQKLKDGLIEDYTVLNQKIKKITQAEPNLHVLSFDTKDEGQRAEVSRIVSKHRDIHTKQAEYTFYTQRAYEILFRHAFIEKLNRTAAHIHRYQTVETPITHPCQNYSVQQMPDIDADTKNIVICIMLRGTLLPSLVLSKEIQDYTSVENITPFALFRINRQVDFNKTKESLNYVIDLNRSYFDKEQFNNAHLVFADPANANGCSILTLLKYLKEVDVKPAKVSLLHVITALPSAINLMRTIPGISLYTLWMDPILNADSYILPGLGDAAERLNGEDPDCPRNLIQLISNYGLNVQSLYYKQIRAIEQIAFC